jgi:hypothetical protein
MQFIDQGAARKRVGAQAADPSDPDHRSFHRLHRACLLPVLAGA